MTACVHEDPTADRPRIETPPTVQTWLPGNPVIPGRVWCWAHVSWEPIPTTTKEGSCDDTD